MDAYNVCVVEDDQEIRDGIGIYLVSQGYHVFKAANGQEGLDIISKEEIHLAIVDVMMPVMDGITMVMKLREKYDFPVIMLSAKSEEVDKIMGLNMGADDYVTKPFSPKEVMARIAAVTKRHKAGAAGQKREIEKFEGLEIDMKGRNVYVDGQKLELTPKEYELLFYLVKNKGIALSREKLLSDVWGFDFYGDDRTVDTHIKMLRSNLKEYRKFIVTLRGLGYKFEA